MIFTHLPLTWYSLPSISSDIHSPGNGECEIHNFLKIQLVIQQELA